MSRRYLLILILLIVSAAAGWLAREATLPSVGGNRVAGEASSGGDSSKAAPDQSAMETIVGLGRIEPAGGIIDVGAMMGDRIGRILVAEGEQVEPGARLAELESRELRSLELEAAGVQLQQAEGRLAVESRLADIKIRAAELGVRKAEAAESALQAQKEKTRLLEKTLAQAVKDRERIEGLSKELATEQDREKQALLVEQAETELASARAALEQAALANRLGLEAAQLELEAAREAKLQLPFAVPIKTLQMNNKLAAAQFKRTEVLAPCAGTILKIYARQGETIGAKPILQIADTRRMVVAAEVYENEVKHIRIGREVRISSKAFASPYDRDGLRGKVVRIGRMVNAPLLRSVDPFAPADRHVVEVRVELDEEGSRQTATLSNLQVDVRFLKGGEG